MEDIQIRSFQSMHDSGTSFVQSAHRMEQRLEDLMKRVNAMQWDSDGRTAYQAIQVRFNNAYTDLKSILNDLGTNVSGIATRHQDTEKYLANNVWGGGGGATA
jgi:uncharacterized protein YukE